MSAGLTAAIIAVFELPP